MKTKEPSRQVREKYVEKIKTVFDPETLFYPTDDC